MSSRAAAEDPTTGVTVGLNHSFLEEHTGSYEDHTNTNNSISDLNNSGSGYLEDSRIHRVNSKPVSALGSSGSWYSYYTDLLSLYFILAFFGITGCLARMGLQVLTDYPGSQYGGVLWANFTGCLIMGYLVRDTQWTSSLLGEEANGYKRNYRGVYSLKTEIPLYIGLVTGVCGSITSFSSFVIELFYLAANLDEDKRYAYKNPGYGVMSFLSYLIVTLAVSFFAFHMGKHTSAMTEHLIGTRDFIAKYELALQLLLAVLGLCSWVIMLVLTITKPTWRDWVYPCVFAPLGVYARFWSGRLLNPLSKKFLWGTFFANISGTILICVTVLLQRGIQPSSVNSSDVSDLLIRKVVSCQTLAAIETGFCGNYTTISTFVAELSSLRRRWSYIYGVTSISIGFICTVLILGSYSWTNGFSKYPVC